LSLFQDDPLDAENRETLAHDNVSNYSSISQPINTIDRRTSGMSGTSARPNVSAASATVTVTDSTTVSNNNTATRITNTNSPRRAGEQTAVGRPGLQAKPQRRRKRVGRKRYRPYGSHTVTVRSLHCTVCTASIIYIGASHTLPSRRCKELPDFWDG
jgi:cytoskeletal protein RodZ